MGGAAKAYTTEPSHNMLNCLMRLREIFTPLTDVPVTISSGVVKVSVWDTPEERKSKIESLRPSISSRQIFYARVRGPELQAGRRWGS